MSKSLGLRGSGRGAGGKELRRKHEFGEASYYRWTANFGCANVSEVQRVLQAWAAECAIKHRLIEPVKSTQNASIEI